MYARRGHGGRGLGLRRSVLDDCPLALLGQLLPWYALAEVRPGYRWSVLADAAVAFSLGQQNLGSLTPGTSASVPVDTGVTLPVF